MISERNNRLLRLLVSLGLSGICAVAQAQHIDMALNKPATASSALMLPSNAVDNNPASRWESQHNQDTAHLTIDLGFSTQVSSLVIDWERASAGDYQILGSNTPEGGWQHIASVANGQAGARTDLISVQPSLQNNTYRYLRVLCTKRSPGNLWGYSIYSLQANAPFGARSVSSNSIELSVDGAAWADVHYRINSGAQVNVRMNRNTQGRSTLVLDQLPPNAMVEYSFTIGRTENGAYDTGWLRTNCCSPSSSSSSLFSSSMTSSRAASSTPIAARSSARPISSSVGAVSSRAASSRAAQSSAVTSTIASSRAALSSSSAASSNALGSVVPLFNSRTRLEPELVRDAVDEQGRPYLSTWFSDRGRDRHHKESHPLKVSPGMTEAQIAQALQNGSGYDHYLAHYWQDRTVVLEIRDYVAKGGTEIDFETHMLSPLNPNTRDFRVWFLGQGTLAEFYDNSYVTLLPGKDRHYRFSDARTNKRAVNFNPKANRPIRVGDRMEIEVSQFLDPNALETAGSRNNYYGTTFLYMVGGGKGDEPNGIVPWEGRATEDRLSNGQLRTCNADRIGRRDSSGFLIEPDCPVILDSFPLPQIAWLGGRTTLSYQYSNEPTEVFKALAGNIGPGFNHEEGGNAQQFMLGRRLIHTEFDLGTHAERPQPAPGTGRRNAAGTPLDANENFTEHAGKLGPLFYEKSCAGCHFNNGRSIPKGLSETVTNQAIKIAGATPGSTHPMFGKSLQPSSLTSATGAGEMSTQLIGFEAAPNYLDGSRNNLQKPVYRFIGAGTAPASFSVRNSPPFIGVGLLEAVPESAILALEASPPAPGISGKAQRLRDVRTGETRLGRFGWKAGAYSVENQIALALRDEMGITTPMFRQLDCGTNQADCQGTQAIELGQTEVDLMSKYVSLLGVPARRNLNSAAALRGENVFRETGCNACHVEQLKTSTLAPLAELRDQTIRPYTDLLLHDMGPGLADSIVEGVATGSEWRTPPLWGIGLTEGAAGFRQAYLHDGRAKTLEEAILWHDGEAAASRRAYSSLSQSDQRALIQFLQSL